MEPFEVMISESQERMLCVVEPEQARRGARRLREVGGARHGDRRGHRHAPPARARGRRAGGRHAGRGARRRLPALRPRARRAGASRSTRRRRAQLDGGELARGHAARPARLAERRLASAGRSSSTTGSSGSRTARRPEEADAAVLMLEPDGGSGAIAVSIDGNGRRVACDPYTGAVEAVLECARNLACVGAEPLGLTNCLNFGNPEKPHIAWQLTRAVEGLRDACLALGVPVVGGNVSLYNEGGGGPDLPDARRRDGRQAARPGDRAAGAGSARRATRSRWSGRSRPSLAGSELEKLQGELSAELPAIDLDAHARRARRDPRGGALGRRRDRARRLRGRPRLRARRVLRSPGGIGARRVRPRTATVHAVRRGPRRRDRSRAGARTIERLAESPATARFSGDRRDGREPARHHGRRCYALACRSADAQDGLRAALCRPVRMTPLEPIPDRDGPRDECGVFGVYAPELRRRAPRVLRALRAPAPRPGVRRASPRARTATS